MAKPVPKGPNGQANEAASAQDPRYCTVCETKLSVYNPGPNCWQHTIGYPWRGPTAKPKYQP